MNSVKIMHTADMHLGASVSRFDDNKNRIRMHEIQKSAIDVLNKAADCDVVLLSGDIFDSPVCRETVADELLSTVSSLPDTRFFMSCGNHDPYGSRIIDYCIKNAPDNFFVFGSEFVECFTIEEKKLRVYGISFSSQFQNTSLLKNLPQCDNSYTNILCVHGEVTAGESIYNPVNLEKVKDAGFDYCALGHIHAFSGIRKYGNLYYAYPGVHEPNGFDETGKKGYISGTVGSDGNFSLRFIPSAKRLYVDESVDISDIESYSSLVSRLNAIAGDGNICRFTLTGTNKFASLLNTSLVESQINAFSAEVTDMTTVYCDIEEYADSFNLKGLCASEVLKLIENADERDEKVYRKAAKILFDLLDGRGDDNDY